MHILNKCINFGILSIFNTFIHMNNFAKFRKRGIIGMLAMISLLLCCPVIASAQVYVGYANPQETVYPYTGFTNSSTEELTLLFVIRVEASKFANYENGTLTGMHVGWGMGNEEITPEMEVFVREDLDGENLASGKGQAVFGWNNIMFDTPYTITSGKDLYLGGKVAWKPGAWLGTGIFGYNLPENSQFMGNTEDVDADGKINWVNATDNNMVILALGIVEAGGSEFIDMASLTDVRVNDVQSMEYPGDAWLKIKNEGVNYLNDIEISASLGDATWTHPITFGSPIGAGEEKDVTGGIQALGTGIHKVWLSKVNGKEVEKPSVIELEMIGVPADVASEYTRRPLIERWVSESEYRSPVYTDDIFMPGVEPFKDEVSLVAHHASDQFMIFHEFDKDVDSEDIKFLMDFANGDKSKVYLPVFSVDRSFLPRNPLARYNRYSVAYDFIYPDYIGGLYASALEVPTFASVNTSVNVDGNKCDIQVSGNVEAGIMPAGEPLYLTVYLVEDGIVSNSQEFPDDEETINRYQGVYTHSDVIRLSLTDMYGAALEGEGAYSKEFTCELEPEWNKDKMRVIAFLNRSGERYGHMQVINSNETGLGKSAVETVSDGNLKRFTAVDGSIVSACGSNAEVYTLEGRRVANHDLRPGIYVVKTTDEEGISACKVTVK